MGISSIKNHSEFWGEQPALLFGLSLLIGSSSFLFASHPWNWIWPLLWAIYLASQSHFSPIAVLLGGILYSWALFSPVNPANEGYFSISFLKPHQTPFDRGLMYKGMLSVQGQRVPCTVYHPLNQHHPKANCDYILHGKLKERSPYDYVFQAKEWIPVRKTWSFAEARFQMKERFRRFLKEQLKTSGAASFLNALITGDVEDRTLRYEFGKVGLQHILAISGFHFAILIAFCSFFLDLFLSYRWKYITLLVAINVYFLFVGSVPAVQRSWLTALFYLTGKLIGRQSSGLNLLGAALLIEILLDPLTSGQVGFQLSFLSCGGILLLAPLFKPWVEQIFPKQNPSTLSSLAQHQYLLTSFFREAITVAAAVTTAILPVILHHFHSFPLLSFIYNLFFPALVSIALFSLLMALLIYVLFPPLAVPVFALTNFLTTELLEWVSYPPLALDYSLQVHYLPAWIIPFYLFALFSLSRLTNTSQFE